MLQLFLHLFSGSRWVRIACHTLMAATILWTLADWVFFFLCRPLSIGQDESSSCTKCGPMYAGYLTIQSFNVFLNACVGLLPAPILFRLQIPLSTKIGVTIMFVLTAPYVLYQKRSGLVSRFTFADIIQLRNSVCLVSAARIINFHLIFRKIDSDFSDSDFTYDGSILYFFTVMEPLVICSLACIPFLCPVVDRVFRSFPGPRTKSLFQSLGMRSTMTQDNHSHTESFGGPHAELGRSGKLSNRPSEGTLGRVDHQSPESDGEAQGAVPCR